MTVQDTDRFQQDLVAEMHQLQRTVDKLELQLQYLEKQNHDQYQLINRLPERLPETALLSNRFLKRAFAVFGHQFAASLVISLALWGLIFLATFFVGCMAVLVN